MNMGKRICCAILLYGASTMTAAQMASPIEDAQNEALASGAPSEIVVNAQRRDQIVREEPLAVSALGGDQFMVLKTQNVTSLVLAIPSISGAYQGALQRFVIRPRTILVEACAQF
jgi:outer membrane receptor protein involved in Fe transport